MAEKIQLRRSAVTGNVPTTSQIDLGEIAINTYDGKLFIKKDDGTASIIEVGDTSAIDDLPSVVSTTYLFTTSTGSTASANVLGFDNANWASATAIYASVTNSKGKNITAGASQYLKVGTIVLVQNMSSTAGADFLRAKVSSVNITATTVQLGITNVTTSGSTPTLLDNLTFGGIPTTNGVEASGQLKFTGNTVPVYSNNSAAKTGGLVDGDVYRSSTGVLHIVYTD